MTRRNFLGLLSGAAAWPLVAHGQERPRFKVGLLIPANPGPFFREFGEGMASLGYDEGKNLDLVFRSAEGDPRRLVELAAQLVQLKVDVIVAAQTPAVTAAMQQAADIPIVMAPAGDPVGTGLVASLARPGGNITGLSGTTTEMGGKQLELLRELLPQTDRVAVLANAADPFTRPFLEQIETGGRNLRIAVHPTRVQGAAEYDAVFAEAKKMASAVIIQPSLPRQPAIELALKYRVATISPASLFAREGGLLSYSADQAVLYRRSALFVDRILKGARPADLPVEQPTKFEFIINLRTAKVLGLAVPPTILARADQVIE